MTRLHAALFLAAMVSAVALSGCARPPANAPLSAGDDDAAPVVQVSPTPPAASARGRAASQALAAYRSYQRAFTAAFAHPSDEDRARELRRHVADPLRSQLDWGLDALELNSLVQAGAVRTEPQVSTVTLAPVPTATIEDCYDNSAVKVFDTRNQHNAIAPHQLARYKVTSTVEDYGKGHGWLITKAIPHRDQPC